jgi:hypothetical protein
VDQLCAVLCELCIPVAGRRIVQLQHYKDTSVVTTDQLMMEFELCIGLIFKPLRHHIHHIIDCSTDDDVTNHGKKENLPSIWFSVLSVLETFFCSKSQVHLHDEVSDEFNSRMPHVVISDELKATMCSLAHEHLQSAVQTLLLMGVLNPKPIDAEDLFTQKTWESVWRMGISEAEVQQWKQQAMLISKNEVASSDK